MFEYEAGYQFALKMGYDMVKDPFQDDFLKNYDYYDRNYTENSRESGKVS